MDCTILSSERCSPVSAVIRSRTRGTSRDTEIQARHTSHAHALLLAAVMTVSVLINAAGSCHDCFSPHQCFWRLLCLFQSTSVLLAAVVSVSVHINAAGSRRVCFSPHQCCWQLPCPFQSTSMLLAAAVSVSVHINDSGDTPLSPHRSTRALVLADSFAWCVDLWPGTLQKFKIFCLIM